MKTKTKAGALTSNHNEAKVRDAAPGLKVQTNVKAGDGKPDERQGGSRWVLRGRLGGRLM